MSFFASQAQAFASANWELSLIFEDLADQDLWKRAHPNLLSVGELVAHVVYSQASYANQVDAAATIESPLAKHEARYYYHTLGQPIVMDMTVAEMAAELDRVQKLTSEAFLRSNANREDPLTFEGPGRTFGEFADYMVFHVAYHAGQAFSVRHLMGHKTNDN